MTSRTVVALLVTLSTIGLALMLYTNVKGGTQNIPEGNINDAYANMIEEVDNGNRSYIVSPLLVDYQIANALGDRAQYKPRYKNGENVYTFEDIKTSTRKIVSGLDYGIYDKTDNINIAKRTGGLIKSINVDGDLISYLGLKFEGDYEDDDFVYFCKDVYRQGSSYCINIGNLRLMYYTSDYLSSNKWKPFEGVLRVPRDVFSTELTLNKSWKSMYLDIGKYGFGDISQVVLFQMRASHYADDNNYDSEIKGSYKFMLKDSNDNVIAGGYRKLEEGEKNEKTNK